MKKIAIITLLLFCAPSVALSGWMEDWLSSKTSSGGGYYKGQSRGYFSGGSFKARWKMSNEDIINFEPPRIKSGCGGIDAFAGGLGFLDADRLVQKLQSIMQAAPAVAFDTALKAMCKECSDTIRTFEMMANDLNGALANDCALAKKLASFAPTDYIREDNMLNETFGRVNQEMGKFRDWYEGLSQTNANNGVPTGAPATQATKTCSNDFKEIFSQGSLIHRISEDLGFEKYADLLRGMLGDVTIALASNGIMYDMDTIPPCRQNDPYTLEDFIFGSSEEREVGKDCKASKSQNFDQFVSDKMESIATKLTNGKPDLTDEEKKFIDGSPLPVEKTLRLGSVTGDMDGAKSIITDVVATAQAYHAVDDLYRNLDYLLKNAKHSANNPHGSTGNQNFCNPIIFQKAITEIETWHDQVKEIRFGARDFYVSEIQNLVTYQNMIKIIMERSIQANTSSYNKLKTK